MTAMISAIQANYAVTSEEFVPATRHQAALAAMASFNDAITPTYDANLPQSRREWKRWSICMRWLAAIRQLGLEVELENSIMFSPSRLRKRATEHAQWAKFFETC